MKLHKPEANNCKIHPILYSFYLRLKPILGVELVHRRKRTSSTCIEVIFYTDDFMAVKGHLNMLREAEYCGYWIMCRPQTSPRRMYYHGHRVFQLFLTPVHPKKNREKQPVNVPLCADDAATMVA